jgi:hypothetical protein
MTLCRSPSAMTTAARPFAASQFAADQLPFHQELAVERTESFHVDEAAGRLA